MSAMSIISTAAIVLLCMYLIISPYLRRNEHGKINDADNHHNEETVDMKALMATLNEIEFDFISRKISEKDYHRLSRQYESMISRAMHEKGFGVKKGDDEL